MMTARSAGACDLQPGLRLNAASLSSAQPKTSQAAAVWRPISQGFDERCGSTVVDIVRDCTDTSGTPGGGEKEPWLQRKTRFIASLEHKPEASILVTAADNAHNAGDMVLDGLAPAGYADRLAAQA